MLAFCRSAMFVILASALAVLSACATTPQPSTPEERSLRADELFSNFDIDGNGYLTRSELEGGVRYLALGVQPGMSGDVMLGLKTQTKARKSPPRPKATRPLTAEEMNKAVNEAFAIRDTDLDKRLSREEFKKMIVERPTTPGENDFWEPFM